MKDLVDVIPFLQAYEPWVRWLVLLWLLLTAGLIGVLVLAERTPSVAPRLVIDALRIPAAAKRTPLTLDLLVRNPAPSAAQLVELQLALYGEQKPAGGLQSFSSESATYVLAAGDAAGQLLVAPAGGGLQYPVQINRPFQGQDYVELNIPLSQAVKKDETDRFVIRFDTDALPGPGHRNLEAVIRYNGDLLTAPYVVGIP